MCGIAGFWNYGSGSPVDFKTLETMCQTLAHRGPDDRGLFVDRALGLAHRRLAILDLSPRGHQPMSTPDGRYTIVFNGEIYNYRELLDHPAIPRTLRSASDTEVLLHLLAREGHRALSLLRGMFAFALWDRVLETLLLARDPFGKKPLYYADVAGTFLFASEPKALLAHPRVSRDIDPAALPKYFLYEYVPAPATIYRDLRQLPMGHLLRVTKTSRSVTQWWKPSFLPKVEERDDAVTLAALDEDLRRAVRRRMIADVPVGIFLSGGLDSTAIAWYMRQVANGALHSFSVSFSEPSFDESAYARLAARALGTEHQEVPFSVDRFHETLAELLPLVDEPFADASLLPTYVVSKAARPHITVALDGDGGDELFGGYGTFRAARVAQRLSWLPLTVKRFLRRSAAVLPTSYENFSSDFLVKSFLKGLPYQASRRNQVWLGSFDDDEQRELLNASPYRAALPRLFEDIDHCRQDLAGLSVDDAVSLLTIVHYLGNGLLTKLDRAAMAVALEVRTPFLDLDLAERALRLPVRWKREKRALKRLMTGRIPQTIISRSKKGFGIPLGFWLRGPLRPFAEATLSTDKLQRDGILNLSAVARLLREHAAGTADHRKKLWTLLMFQLWFDRWIARRSS